MNTILLVDPYPVVTYALDKLLKDAGIDQPVLHAHTKSQAQQAVANKLAMLIFDPILFGDMPDKLVVMARRKHPELPVILFGSQPHGIQVALAQTLGVNGYLDKTSDLPSLIATIRMVLSGMQCFPHPNGFSAIEHEALQSLTPRELVVLQFLRQGLRNKDIAERLLLSPQTVSSHKRTLQHKLGIDSVLPKVKEKPWLRRT